MNKLLNKLIVYGKPSMWTDLRVQQLKEIYPDLQVTFESEKQEFSGEKIDLVWIDEEL